MAIYDEQLDVSATPKATLLCISPDTVTITSTQQPTPPLKLSCVTTND